MFQPTSPENAADLETIERLLSEVSIGATLTYAEINAALGRDVRQKRWLLSRAIALVEEKTGGLFSVIRSEGVMRLESESIPDVGLAAIQKVRRTARRGHERLASVRVNDLSEGSKARIIAHRSQLGAIALVADGRKTPRLTKETSVTGAAIPAGRVLELFSRNQE